jgi:hypothetical protein
VRHGHSSGIQKKGERPHLEAVTRQRLVETVIDLID